MLNTGRYVDGTVARDDVHAGACTKKQRVTHIGWQRYRPTSVQMTVRVLTTESNAAMTATTAHVVDVDMAAKALQMHSGVHKRPERGAGCLEASYYPGCLVATRLHKAVSGAPSYVCRSEAADRSRACRLQGQGPLGRRPIIP